MTMLLGWGSLKQPWWPTWSLYQHHNKLQIAGQSTEVGGDALNAPFTYKCFMNTMTVTNATWSSLIGHVMVLETCTFVNTRTCQ